MIHNYFQLLGIKATFDLDNDLLLANHRKLQQSIHPDRFAASSHAEKLAAVTQMAQINEAFQILKNPVTRAEYLLQLSGWDKPGDEQTIKSLPLLMEQMALREELEEIETADNSQQLLDVFCGNIDQMTQQQLQQLSTEFQQKLSADTIYLSITRLKFLTKLKSEVIRLDEKLEELDD
ncbi:MAG: Fe-S protein assembly co-chaperone HscB [Gammaproteobacteria bacterium CG22_combo_CG10-13_8_21_14_all_40_8]|nr:MAG: Fe-S protein assembly co-chaperone HscB [Gammaproteobacteria bacterium CG22_combo_CG10-13_8_21_14_all_40_8]